MQGSGRNVICDQAKLELEVRGASTEINRYMEKYARTILQSSAAMHSVPARLRQLDLLRLSPMIRR